MAKKKVYHAGESYDLVKGKGASVRVDTSKGYIRFEVEVKTMAGRHRKYFPSPEEANAYAIEHNKEVHDYGESFRGLSHDERRAVDIYRHYKKEQFEEMRSVRSLMEIISEAIEREKQQNASMPLSEVTEMYRESLDKRNVSEEHAKIVKWRLLKLCSTLGNQAISSITPADIEHTIYNLTDRKGRPLSTSSLKGYFVLCKALFTYAAKRRIVTMNPVEAITLPRERRKAPDILTAQQIQIVLNDLLLHAPEAIPEAVLGIFCGTRLSERCRLTFGDIGKGRKRELTISPHVAKTGIARFTPLPNCAIEWILAARKAGVLMDTRSHIVPGQTETKRKEYIRRIMDAQKQRIKLDIPRNAFRHSAASYLCAYYEDLPKVALWLGHSVQILNQHYRNAVTRSEGEEFLRITPQEKAPANRG